MTNLLRNCVLISAFTTYFTFFDFLSRRYSTLYDSIRTKEKSPGEIGQDNKARSFPHNKPLNLDQLGRGKKKPYLCVEV